MPTVLLLHPPDAPFEVRRLVDVLAERVAGVRARVFRPHHAVRLFREWRRLSAEERPAVIHAFDGPSLAAAVLATDAPVVYTAPQWPTHRDVLWLRALSRYRPVRVLCDSDTERRVWVTGGLPADRCVLIRPGVSLATPGDRDAARARFGLTPADRVVFVPLRPSGEGRARALWAGSLMNVIDPNTKLLAWDPPPARGVAGLRARLLDPAAVRSFDDAAPAAGFVAADAVLLPPIDPVPATITAMAMASGKPIVAPTTPSICELLEDRHTALLAGGLTIQALARRIADVFEDDALRAKITDRARAEVYDFFLLSRMTDDYRRFYATLGAERIQRSTTNNRSGDALSSPLPLYATGEG